MDDKPMMMMAMIMLMNWHGPGESECLIKTKQCDGRSLVLTVYSACEWVTNIVPIGTLL